MTAIDHEYWAREVLKFLILHIQKFQGGNKHIYYGVLAEAIGYPQPYAGSGFANRIGYTLGAMGHLIEDIVIDGCNPPYINSLVVAKSSNLPGDGIKEFYFDYPFLTTEKKRDFISSEVQRIFDFGNRWEKLLYELKIKPRDEEGIVTSSLYNPYGSEGSPAHRALRNYIFEHPEFFGITPLYKYREYPLKSGDAIDVLFEMSDEMLGIEVKSGRSGMDDYERGIFQCVKYQAVLEAENKIQSNAKTVRIFLVLEDSLPKKLIRMRDKLGIIVVENFQRNNN